MPDPRPWFEDAFRDDYLRLYPHRDLDAARAEIAGLVASGIAGRTLDLGCGFGRHALALSEAGLDVVGLDRSAELLHHSRMLPDAVRLAGRLVRADFRTLPFRDEAFDSVLMLFSTFGYLDDAGNRDVLGELARVLRPGGRAALDLMNPARVRAGLVAESRGAHEGFELVERRRLEQAGRRVVKEVVMRAGGEERRWREDVRLYEPAEIAALAAAAGLRVLRTEGDFDGRRFEAGSPRQIVWLGRQAGPGPARDSPS